MTIAVLMRGILWGVGCGLPLAAAAQGDTSVRDYLDNLPPLVMVESIPGQTREIPELRHGLTGSQIVGGRFVNKQPELSLLRSFGDITWPGALVQGASIDRNRFSPINQLPRSGGRISVTSDLVLHSGDLGDARYYREIDEMTLSETNQQVKEMINELNASDSAGVTDFQVVTAGSRLEAMVKLGVAYEGGQASASADLRTESESLNQTYYVKYTQKFYKVTFEPIDADYPFFAPSVTVNDVKRFARPGNPPLYVSEVIYGRILIMSFTTSMARTEFEGTFEAAFSPDAGNRFEASGAAEARDKLEQMRVRVLSVGATGETSSDLLDLQDEQLLGRLQSYIKSGSQFDSRTNPGAPIGIVMRYVGSVTDTSGPGTIAIAQMVTDNSPEVVNVTTKKTCQREDGTPYVYSVWDGAGGGTVDTGIDLLPGDHVEITATGENQSGVFGTGTYGPNGWDDKAPFGAGAEAFPVRNHHPFALIARIGAVARIGNDALGNTGDSDNPRDDETSLYGTWFFVGAGQSFWVGRRTDQGGVPSYGRLYLATNDNNPLNGDPKHKFSVSVCYTPAAAIIQ